MKKTIIRFVSAVLAFFLIPAAGNAITFIASGTSSRPAKQPEGFARGKEYVLFDQDGIKLTLTGEVDDEDLSDIILYAVFENRTEHALNVMYTGSVNGIPISQRGLSGALTEPGETGECKFRISYMGFGLQQYTDIREMELSFEIKLMEVEKSSSSSSSSFSSGSGGVSVSSSSSASSSVRSARPVGTYRTVEGVRISFLDYREASSQGQLVYFREQSVLPSPINYADVAVCSSSSSSSNGKVTSASYGFGARDSKDDIGKLLDAYLKGLNEAGFSVSGSGGEYLVSDSRTVLAKITLEDKLFRVSLIL